MKIKNIFCNPAAVLMAIVVAAVIAMMFLRMHENTPLSAGVVSTASTSAATADSLQRFSGNGYALSVPSGWSIEQIASSAIAIHGSSGCIADLFQFPFPAGTDMNAWISKHISADPSLSVVKISAEDVPLANGTSIRWRGTIDGISTTIIYAFSAGRVYEISPSTDGCNDTLETITAHLIFQ